MANRFILNETSYFGPGSISVIPDEVAARGFKKAFVVTDKSLMQFKVATKVLKVLDDAKIAYAVFDDVKPNPTIENVQTGVKAFTASGADCIVTRNTKDYSKAPIPVYAPAEFIELLTETSEDQTD